MRELLSIFCNEFSELKFIFTDYYTSAQKYGNKENQMKCFGIGIKCMYFDGNILKCSQFDLEFPTLCKTYAGPHSVACLNQIWTEKGCLLDSDVAPEKLNSTDLSVISSLTLRYLFFYRPASQRKHDLLENLHTL